MSSGGVGNGVGRRVLVGILQLFTCWDGARQDGGGASVDRWGHGAGELSLGRPSRGQIGPLCRRVFGMPRQPRGKATHLPAGFRRWEKPAPRGAPALWEDLSTRGRSRGFPPARGRVLSSGAGAWDPGEGKRVTRWPRSGLPALWEDLSTRGRSRGFPPARGRVLSSGAGAWDPGEGKRVTRWPRSGLCDFPQSQMARGRSRGFPPARGRVLSSGAGAWDPGEGKRVTRWPRSGLCDFPQSQMAEIRTLRLTLLVAQDTNSVSPQAHAVLSPPHALPAPKTASQTSHLSHPTRPLRRKPPISARHPPRPRARTPHAHAPTPTHPPSLTDC